MLWRKFSYTNEFWPIRGANNVFHTWKKKHYTVIDETNMKLLTGGRSNELCKKNKRGTNSLLWFAVNVPK